MRKPKPGVCGLTRGRALGLSLACLTLTGCESPMDRLDRRAGEMIQRRQTLALGADAPNDPTLLPPASAIPGSGASLYDTNPGTTNPALEALPVTANEQPVIDTEQLPEPIADAGEPLELALGGILAYAIEHAPEYRRRKEDLFLTTLALIIERHLWGPRFFSTISGQLEGTPESGDYDTATTLVAELGVTQRLPYGGSVSASALVDYVAFLQQASDNTDPEETQSAAINLGLDLPLLRGAGQAAREDRIQAERDLIYAVRGFERFRREFLVDVSRDYFDLIFSQQQIVNQRLQLRNLEQVAKQFRALADAGKERGFRAEQLEQDVLRARNTLLNQRERYANDLDRFKIDLGMPTETPLVVKPVTVTVPAPELRVTEATATALTFRLDLQTEADTVEDARRSVEVSRNQLLPDLNLDADLTLPTTSGKNRAGVDLDAGEGEYSVGVLLELPVDRLIEEANLRSALVRYERARRDYEVERREVALDVRSAIRTIEQARFSLELQKRNVMLNERRALEVSIRRRSLGPRDVLDAQEDLVDSRNARDRAEADLRTAILDFLLATGQMRVGPDGKWQAPAPLSPIEIVPEDLPDVDPELEDIELAPQPAAPAAGADLSAAYTPPPPSI